MNRSSPIIDQADRAAGGGEPPLLDVTGLSVELHLGGVAHRVVDSVDLRLAAGQLMALVGESGSGKSLTAKAIARLLPARADVVAGAVRLSGRDVLTVPAREMDAIRGRHTGFVFQDHMASLDPTMSVRRHFRLALRHAEARTWGNPDSEAASLLSSVGIPDPARVLRLYPHQLSGGMGQRVLIALAISCRPELLIADEPTTALDVTVQAQVLALLRDLATERGMGVILITHDLGVAAQVCDTVSVMYAGRLVESGPARTVFTSPAMPYTTELLKSLPHVLADDGSRYLPFIPGDPPPIGGLALGCQFAPRCPHARDACQVEEPRLGERDADRTHLARCLGTEPGGWVQR